MNRKLDTHTKTLANFYINHDYPLSFFGCECVYLLSTQSVYTMLMMMKCVVYTYRIQNIGYMHNGIDVMNVYDDMALRTLFTVALVLSCRPPVEPFTSF